MGTKINFFYREMKDDDDDDDDEDHPTPHVMMEICDGYDDDDHESSEWASPVMVESISFFTLD